MTWSACSSLCITGRLWNYVELKGLNRDLWQQMLRFSLPMIPAQISFWVINASDLFFVREMCGGLDGHSGDAWSGLLSTGYFLPTIPDHAGSDLLRCLAALRRDRGGGPRPVLYQDLPHLFLGAVLLCGGHHLALPPGHARDEGQLLLRLALCALPDAGFHLQLLPTSSSTAHTLSTKVHPQPVDHAGRCCEQLHYELLLHQVVGAHRRNSGFLLRSGHRVRAARWMPTT